MVEPLKNELLSAYLDDALSAAERVRVERHLAASPEDRQLVEELRVLHESLQGLPRHELPASFREKILRQAERAMLTQPVETPVAARAATPNRPKWLPVSYRALAWPAAVIAVAITLMVVSREDPRGKREVAQVAKPLAKAVEGEGAERRRVLPQMRSRSAGESRGETDPGLVLKEDLGRENVALAPAEPVRRSPAAASPVAPPPPAAVSSLALKRKSAAKVEEAKATVGEEPKLAARQNEDRPSKAGLGISEQTVDRYADGKAGPPRQESLGDKVVDSRKAASAPTDRLAVTQRLIEQAGHGILLVQVDVSRKAAEAHAFEQLLKRQQIASQQQMAPGQAGQGGTVGSLASELAGAGVEVIYAEATESQVKAALEDLRERGDEFPAFGVQPDPSQPRQAQFGTFRRGRPPSERRHDFAFWKKQEKTNIEARISESVARQSERFGGSAQRGLTPPAAGQGGMQRIEDEDERLRGQQASKSAKPAGQLDHFQAAAGYGGRGRSLAAEAARPLQVVFLLRVVDPQPASTAAPAANKPK